MATARRVVTAAVIAEDAPGIFGLLSVVSHFLAGLAFGRLCASVLTDGIASICINHPTRQVQIDTAGLSLPCCCRLHW